MPSYYPYRVVASLDAIPEAVNLNVKGPVAAVVNSTSYTTILPAQGSAWQIVVTGLNFSTAHTTPVTLSLRQGAQDPQWVTVLDSSNNKNNCSQGVSLEPRWVLEKNAPLQAKVDTGSANVVVQFYVAAH